MAELTEVRVPDIGDFSEVPVIEILVEVGDRIRPEDPLVTLESDKATMDVPAPAGGVVREVAVAVGDNVSEGSVLLWIAAGNGGGAAGEESAPAGAGGSGAAGEESAPAGAGGSGAAGEESVPADAGGSGTAGEESAPAGAGGSGTADMAPAGSAGAGVGGGTPPSGSFDTRVAGEAPASPAGASAEIASRESSEIVEVRVPDIGDFSDVPVIEVLVGAGDRIRPEDPLVSLESDKATMDVPSPVAGRVVGIALSVGDLVSEGALILTVESAESTEAAAPAPLPGPPDAVAPEPADGASVPDPRAPRGRPSPTAALAAEPAPRPISHATPAMRRYARELGVDLAKVTGTGRKGRVLREDVSGFVKRALSAPAPAEVPAAAGGSGIPPIPAVDFSKFGEIETRPLSRIKRISGPHLHRAWVNVPHVTSHDEADVTELEAFRRSIREEAAVDGVRITLLAFITKAVASALAEFPTFNASLGPDGDTLIVKKYIHIGIAVDTPNGLMVPVLRDAGRKGVYDLAREMAGLGARARDGALKSGELQGGTFTISSLGGIGGTAFTPIINAPEVAILGVSRARTAPVWDGSGFAPRLMLPFDLSWDHRVVDGAEAARFLAYLTRVLGDARRLLL